MDVTILNIVVLVLAAIAAVISLFKEYHKQDNDIGFMILLIATILGLGVAITAELRKYANDKNEGIKREAEYRSIIQRADTTLNSVNANLTLSTGIMQNTRQSIHKLDSLQEAAKGLNNQLLQELEIQQATSRQAEKIAQLTLKNSQLQEELLRQTNSSKSLPLLSAIVTDVPKQDRDEALDFPQVWRLAFNLSNLGKYDISNVKVKYLIRQRHNNLKEEEPIGEFHLSAGETLEIKDFELKNMFSSPPDPIDYIFTVTWKTYHYRMLVAVSSKEDMKEEKNKYSMYEEYSMDGYPLYKNEFVKAMLRKID